MIGVVQRSDGDIMAVTTANPSSLYKILCVRISSSFVIQESFYLGGAWTDYARGVIATNDNGFLVIGEENTSGT